ncbi:hypothetical protein EYF80_023228 [Liparis tanakae]|uniref:Uncharacterized protein n=1 Tax=Liparis tanakae TaxID=230148 RepID=A0A4Z2HP39_9TELE|nr:hypothetical protein EYF80_023228 [Liparis tanakae]
MNFVPTASGLGGILGFNQAHLSIPQSMPCPDDGWPGEIPVMASSVPRRVFGKPGGHGRRQGHEDRRPAHQAGSVTKEAGPIRQEAQRRRPGHREGGQIQARGWMPEAGARSQDPGPASDKARPNGPYEARRHKDSEDEVELIEQLIDAARLGSRSEPFSRGMSFCLYASRSGANKKSPRYRQIKTFSSLKNEAAQQYGMEGHRDGVVRALLRVYFANNGFEGAAEEGGM